MGDQLESVNTPRARAVEAQKLMNHFAELMRPEPSTDGILNDPDKVSILSSYMHYAVKLNNVQYWDHNYFGASEYLQIHYQFCIMFYIFR